MKINKLSKPNFTKRECVLIILVVMMMSYMAITNYHMWVDHKTQLAQLREQHETESSNMKEEYNKVNGELNKYKSMYERSSSQIEDLTNTVKSLKDKLDYKNQIAKKREMSMSTEELKHKSLYDFYEMTTDEMNEWIAQRAPQGSPFIGRGDVFLQASEVTKIDPKYILAHAALESTWGTSDIAKTKSNFFGIAAYNKNPDAAKNFDRGQIKHTDRIANGIISGANWIETNYSEKGQDSVYEMIYGNSKHIYAQYKDGSPNDQWMNQIVSIMKSK
jgi:beta-N-acetylglucosaminidase